MAENKGSKTYVAKMGFMAALEKDREMARNTPKNITPNIPGTRVRYKKRGIRVYYYLVKTYWHDGRPHEKVLVYYGTKPPRAAKRDVEL